MLLPFFFFVCVFLFPSKENVTLSPFWVQDDLFFFFILFIYGIQLGLVNETSSKTLIARSLDTNACNHDFGLFLKSLRQHLLCSNTVFF
jgi:hypothetical protein